MSRTIYFSILPALLFVSLLHTPAVAGKTPKVGGVAVSTGNYKDWGYSPTSVYGIGKIDSTKNRYFVKISSVAGNTVKVERYNPAGVMLGKTVLYFANGALNKIVEFNQWGELFAQSTFTKNTEGELLSTRKVRGENVYFPCQKIKLIYSNNLQKESRYYDDSGNACVAGTGAAIIRYKRYTDEKKYSLIKEMSFYNELDSPVMSSSLDCHKVVFEYDEKGNKTSEKYFGTDGLPVANRDGIFGIQYHDGILENILDEDCLGPKGQVINNVVGVARFESIFSDKSFVTMETRHDSTFNVTRELANGDGIAIIQYKRDGKGNETERTFYDEKDKPLNNTNGYQKVTSVYSASNMLTDFSYFDAQSQPFADNTAVHHYNYKKDSVGRIVAVKYFGNTNQPCQDNFDRVYEKRYQYSNDGLRIAESYWAANGGPMNRWNGYHESRLKFNDDGRAIEISYFDTTGNFVKTGNGYSLQKIEYNSRGLVAARSYFDGNNAIMQGKRGTVQNFHIIKYSYDGSRRVNSISYFDTSGQPVNAVIEIDYNYYNCSRIDILYKGARIVEEKFYGLNTEAPIADIDCLHKKYINTSGLATASPNR